jgi:hypothetical protein
MTEVRSFNAIRDCSLHQIYDEAVSFQKYLGCLRANSERFHSIYQRLQFVADDPANMVFRTGTRILILCEPYCADCVINLPLIARLAEASGNSELRVASRDKYRAVAERFPGRGGISRIPTLILFDSNGNLAGYWSERGQSDHEWMSDFTRSDPLPEITLDDGVPTGDFELWLERRFVGQLPIFYEQNWKDVRQELKALADAPGESRPLGRSSSVR